ncbi:hypothetical protein JCM8208_004745 [Rhodotorula glutinis]
MDDVEKTNTVLSEKPYTEHVESSSTFGQAAEPHAGAVKVPARIFTAAEEDKLYRKVDLRLMPILALLYLLSFMDRGNIGNARIEGLEAELGMTSQDYNTALSCFFITYCLCEVPANLVMKKFRRPSVWLGLVTTTWAIVMTLMGVVQNFGGLLACRLALGVAEAGLFPGVILYLSIWYPRARSQARVGFFFGAATLAGAFSGLLAYGIGFMSGGLATLVVGVASFWLISDYPNECGWLTQEEKEWLIYRRATDNSKVGEAEHVSKSFIWSAFSTWQTWLSIGYYLGVVVPLYAISLISPTLVAGLGNYTRAQTQLLTVPYYVVAFLFVMAVSLLSDRFKTRFPFLMIELTLCVIGLVINISPAPSGVKYFGIYLIAMGAYGGLPTSVTWLSNNLSGQTKRAVGSAAQIGLGNLGALASSNVYRKQDKPHYYLGHGVVLGFVMLGYICGPLYAVMLKRENKRKTEWLEQQAMLPEEQRTQYTVEELRAQGDKAADFKYLI